MEKLLVLNTKINAFVWGNWMIILLLCCGALLFVMTKGLPFRKAGFIIKKTIGSLFHSQNSEGITSFQAVSTALAGTLGVGSIVGVATALTIGGPGALFWMCVSAILGMMTKYAEVVLAIHYRVRHHDGRWLGGPMTTLEYGCHCKFLGVLFAIFCMLASFGIGNLTPAQTITETIQTYVEIPSIWIGIVLAFCMYLIVKGKAEGIMRWNEKFVPIISIIYIAACCFLIMRHKEQVYDVCITILKSAFQFSSVLGAGSGYTIQKAMHYGISRGVFSNEAGMGSSPLSHAAVEEVDAVEQGFWGIFEVFFDTLVVCVLSGFVILTSNAYASGLDGVSLLVTCFEEGFGKAGGIVFALSLLFFAIPSILGWYYYALECLRYLFEVSFMVVIYQIVFFGLLMIGGQLELRVVWEIADTLNGCMAIPNLISVVLLYKVVVKLTKEYLQQHGSD